MKTSLYEKMMRDSFGVSDSMDMETYATVSDFVHLYLKETGKAYIGNAFSLQMVTDDAVIAKESVDPADIPEDVESCIGHADTARVVSGILGRDIPAQRKSILLHSGDVLYVAQVVGGRLPEGATELPEGATLKFYRITVRNYGGAE